MTQLKIIFQPPYSMMVGVELLTDPNTRQVDGFCVHLFVVSLEVSWSDNDYI